MTEREVIAVEDDANIVEVIEETTFVEIIEESLTLVIDGETTVEIIEEPTTVEIQVVSETIEIIEQDTTVEIIEPNSAHEILDEGTALAQRPKLDFVGPGVVASDQSGKTRVKVDDREVLIEVQNNSGFDLSSGVNGVVRVNGLDGSGLPQLGFVFDVFLDEATGLLIQPLTISPREIGYLLIRGARRVGLDTSSAALYDPIYWNAFGTVTLAPSTNYPDGPTIGWVIEIAADGLLWFDFTPQRPHVVPGGGVVIDSAGGGRRRLRFHDVPKVNVSTRALTIADQGKLFFNTDDLALINQPVEPIPDGFYYFLFAEGGSYSWTHFDGATVDGSGTGTTIPKGQIVKIQRIASKTYVTMWLGVPPVGSWEFQAADFRFNAIANKVPDLQYADDSQIIFRARAGALPPTDQDDSEFYSSAAGPGTHHWQAFAGGFRVGDSFCRQHHAAMEYGLVAYNRSGGGILANSCVKMTGWSDGTRGSGPGNQLIHEVAMIGATSQRAIGIAIASAANNARVKVSQVVKFFLNTSAAAVGDPVYHTSTGFITLTSGSRIIGRVVTVATSGLVLLDFRGSA